MMKIQIVASLKETIRHKNKAIDILEISVAGDPSIETMRKQCISH